MLTISFSLNSAAFRGEPDEDGNEPLNLDAVAIQIRWVAQRIAHGANAGRVIDENGNHCGEFRLSDD